MYGRILSFTLIFLDATCFSFSRNPWNNAHSQSRLTLQSEATVSSSELETGVKLLKSTLVREYASFFSPMEREFYARDVTFDDPMTSLEGIDSYERNVDMLSGKNMFGRILFRDAGIVLHNIEGGDVKEDGSISDVITRWTLRLTFQAFPWQPTARFTGISVYSVGAGGVKGVQVLKQTDYWDSINIKNGGEYGKVDTGVAVADFLNQLKPDQFAAPSAGTELPYQLLRRGNGYEVRRYPSFSAVETSYERRDLGFSELGAFTSGMNPLAPALMSVSQSASDKKMMWPLSFALPGASSPPDVSKAVEKTKQSSWAGCEVRIIPERVVAVGSFSDASVEPVVKKADRELRNACSRDGLVPKADSEGVLTFAQYDAVYSMGKRRGEVWIDLDDDGHPWSSSP